VLKIGWHNDLRIQELKQPIMFISGDSDELVPPSHMKKLFDLATSSAHKDFYSIFKGHHNDSWDVAGREYYTVPISFITIILTIIYIQ
jgi:fermentation-respiration switch protein FrsA (DUF1100 family)